MANFITTIDNGYSINSFQSVKDTYDWIIASLNKLNMNEEYLSANFLFDIGQITCSANGIDEFIQHAYGASDFVFSECFIHTEFRDKKRATLYIKYDNTIKISSEDKVLLQTLIDTLNRTNINKQSDTTVNNITINGGNNAIANNNSTATVVTDNNKVKFANQNNNTGAFVDKESKFRKAFSAILTNLASNLIWYILCALVGALIAYLIAKQ